MRWWTVRLSRDSVRVFHIGLDDTDSSEGMCTTFLTFNLVKTLLKDKIKKTKLIDYPNLIRLNPNIPWKTRGNAALVLRIESKLCQDELFHICKRMLEKFATSEHANSGLVIYQGEEIPSRISEFSRKALFEVQSLAEARKIMDDEAQRVRYFGLRNCQGLVGALAGIGNELKGDHTFELIAYRKNCAKRRKLDKSRIIMMDQRTRPFTFNCYDEENDRILIMPHGPDPVLLGIRGETPEAVKEAFEMLLPIDNLLGYMIFRSNQGTGEHLEHDIDLSNPKVYTSGRVRGRVISRPRIERGGHVYFQLQNDQGAISCAAYEPTGRFRKDVLSLVVGDLIETGGGIRKNTTIHPKMLNMECMIPLTLAQIWSTRNPKCPKCLASMSSEGRDQGFQCNKCGYKSRTIARIRFPVERSLIENQIYLPDLKAHRHLTKPLQRYNLPRCIMHAEKTGASEYPNQRLVANWATVR